MITRDTILRDMEFEILQEIIHTDDLRQAVRELQRFQAQLRKEMGEKNIPEPYRSVLARQTQAIDMVLALSEEIILRLERVQVSLTGVRQWMPQASPAPPSQPKSPALSPGQVWSQPAMPELPPLDREAVQRVMRPETIWVEFQAKIYRIPLIGPLLTRLRLYYQRPAVFYSQILSNRQAEVNRVLGDYLLRLTERLEAQQRILERITAAQTADDE